jgi:hypothetical protein
MLYKETVKTVSRALGAVAVMVALLALPSSGLAADWDQTLAAARKEGKVVIATAVPSADLRNTWTEIVKNRYGI